MSVRGTSIAMMDKGASSGYKDASSSQEGEMQSDWKIRKLRAEIEAEQATKDDSAKEAKDKEARDKEAEIKEAKDRGAGGAAGEVEEGGGRRSNSSEENGDHPETKGEPSRRWGGSYETEAWGNRRQLGQGSRQGQKGQQDYRILEVRGLGCRG